MKANVLRFVIGAVVFGALSCGSSNTAYCCYNGRYYQCPNSEALNACTDRCTRDSSKDSMCTSGLDV